jgi:hypothetical protein
MYCPRNGSCRVPGRRCCRARPKIAPYSPDGPRSNPRSATTPTLHISSRTGQNARRIGPVPRHFENFFSGIALNPSLTRPAVSGRRDYQHGRLQMSEADYQAAIAAFLRTKGVTRCPTVCAVPTQATVTEADRAAYRDYVAAQEAARLEKQKSLQNLIPPPPLPPM